MNKRLAVVSVLLALATFTGLTTGSAVGAPAVVINNLQFLPPVIIAVSGVPFTFVNTDAIPHTATRTGVFNTGVIAPNGTGDATIATPGTYDYKCSIHPSMTGQVIVLA